MADQITSSNKSNSLIKVNKEFRVPERISWKTISDQMMAVMNIEKGIFYTLIELFFRPGKAVKNHLIKNRTRLVNPVKFLVLSTTLASLATLYFIDFSFIETAFTENIEANSDKMNHDQFDFLKSKFQVLYQKSMGLSYFFLVPLGAISSWFFIRKSYNVPELLVAHAYLWSMVNCFTIILTPFFTNNPEYYSFLGIVFLIYPVYFYTKFFNERFKGLVKGVFLMMVNIFWMLVILVGLAVYVFYNAKSGLFPNSTTF